MKKIANGVLLALIAALVVVLPGQSAHAYPDSVCSIDAPARVAPGETFDVTVTSGEPRDLSVTYGEDTRTKGAATTLTASFTAGDAGTATLSASCGDDIASAELSVAAVGSDAAAADDGDGALAGLLPDTGGAALWVLLLGAAMVLVGGTVAIRRRRA